MSLYEDIFHSIRESIEGGVYAPGDRLPSIRELAREKGCNKLTIKKAFDLLKQKGLVENHVGRGTFVAYPEWDGTEHSPVYGFHSAYICEEFFPTREAGDLFGELFREERGLFAAGPVGGEPELVRTLAERYEVPAQNTIIISGAQQGLNLCSRLQAVNVPEQIVFENPTYSGAISVFKPKHFIPLRSDGPDMEVLRKVVEGKIRFFYVMPEVHNPTGIGYSLEKMKKIAEYSEKYNFFIIEDDYLSEFMDRRPRRFIDMIPERTIYIKSLSKITAPGIRLGFMTVPFGLYRKFLHGKYSADIGTTSLMQRFLTRFIDTGLMDRHLEVCRRILKERKSLMMEVLGRYSFLTVPAGQQGYNLWVHSSKNLEVKNPPWAEGKNFSFSPDFENSFRLSLLGMNERNYERGLAYLDSLFASLAHPGGRPVL
jgi:DNA-binding transcriptional MocR family regulator